MNRSEYDILLYLCNHQYQNQRELSEQLNYSLGTINYSLKNLIQNEYLSSQCEMTDKAQKLIRSTSPKNAIILAAGAGLRMTPMNMDMPKGLLEIHKEPIIERLIKQLHEVGVTDIYIIVGYLKERFEYLIDAYDVKLIVNPQYAVKNNLYSLKIVDQNIGNTYILPSDIWFANNPFQRNEAYSWYMISDEQSIQSKFRVNRKMEIVSTKENEQGNVDIGICYLTDEISNRIRKRINELCDNWHYDNSFWEEALYENEKMIVAAKVADAKQFIELNTYEQLREINEGFNSLSPEALRVIECKLDICEADISLIKTMKRGMTNHTFYFECSKGQFVFRIPDVGTEHLISRKNEAENYEKIRNWESAEKVVYINSKNGYKLTEYFGTSRCCDPNKREDVVKCMNLLHCVHESEIKVEHEFNVFEQIDYYEHLWNEYPSLYKDYQVTKKNIFSLREYVEKNCNKKTFCHIDAAANNFLFVGNDNLEQIHLIDWEYAAMNDPHMDIAMFGVNALYDRSQIDSLIDIYFDGKCQENIRIKIYCYIAACGLFWSNWCEYKRNMGTEFGEFSLRQYRYAKEYYRLAEEMIGL